MYRKIFLDLAARRGCARLVSPIRDNPGIKQNFFASGDGRK
jgi:hypothetical protein